MSKFMKTVSVFVASLTLMLGLSGSIQAKEDPIEELKQRWTIAKYDTSPQEQHGVFLKLIHDADKLTQRYPNDARAQLWHGTILASYAGIKGGVGALKYAKGARAHLESSLKLDPSVEHGLAHGVLGALYARVPGWPMAFGDEKKATYHLQSAVRLNPKGLDSNYYYGDYLVEKGNYDLARKHLTMALVSKQDESKTYTQGRIKEINESLNKMLA